MVVASDCSREKPLILLFIHQGHLIGFFLAFFLTQLIDF